MSKQPPALHGRQWHTAHVTLASVDGWSLAGKTQGGSPRLRRMTAIQVMLRSPSRTAVGRLSARRSVLSRWQQRSRSLSKRPVCPHSCRLILLGLAGTHT